MDANKSCSTRQSKARKFLMAHAHQLALRKAPTFRGLESLAANARVAASFSFATVDDEYIQKAMLHEVDRYRVQTYDHFCLDIRLRPLHHAEPYHNRRGIWLGFAQYELDTRGCPPIPIQIELGVGDEVSIKHCGRSNSVIDFLGVLNPTRADSATLEPPQAQWNRQWAWWRSNGRTFPFLELPAELRDVVYKHTFGLVVKPYPTIRARRPGSRTSTTLSSRPSIKVLYLNRKVWAEASHILFSLTPFCVEHLGVLGALLSNEHQRDRIRRLQLALTHHEFFRLFGGLVGWCGSEEIDYSKPHWTAGLLQRMRLSCLELIVATPSADTGKQCFDGACQRVIVEWLLESAWPTLRGVTVNLSGFVETQQKIAFRSACIVEKQKYRSWQIIAAAVGLNTSPCMYHDWLREQDEEGDGGVRLDGTFLPPTKESLLPVEEYRPRMMPPRCMCDPPCLS